MLPQFVLQEGDGTVFDRVAERRQKLACQRAHDRIIPRRHDPNGKQQQQRPRWWHVSPWPCAHVGAHVLLTACEPFADILQLSRCMVLQVGFNMRKVTKGGVTIKMWDLGGQVSLLQVACWAGKEGASCDHPLPQLCQRLRTLPWLRPCAP